MLNGDDVGTGEGKYEKTEVGERDAESAVENDGAKVVKYSRKRKKRVYLLVAAVARVEAAEIDATDILSARMKAMQQAIDGLAIRPELALVDGNRDKGRCAAITTPHKLVVGGDGKSASIAAASILAKVSRDRFMAGELEALYPQYQFAKHKGYGTKLHYEMLDAYGFCPEHRKSFLKKWEEKHT